MKEESVTQGRSFELGETHPWFAARARLWRIDGGRHPERATTGVAPVRFASRISAVVQALQPLEHKFSTRSITIVTSTRARALRALWLAASAPDMAPFTWTLTGLGPAALVIGSDAARRSGALSAFVAQQCRNDLVGRFVVRPGFHRLRLASSRRPWAHRVSPADSISYRPRSSWVSFITTGDRERG